jgi:hypothetical protein
VKQKLSLAQLLANRRGADIGIFVIDEPDGLDQAGKQALIEILAEMQGAGISRVYRRRPLLPRPAHEPRTGAMEEAAGNLLETNGGDRQRTATNAAESNMAPLRVSSTGGV